MFLKSEIIVTQIDDPNGARRVIVWITRTMTLRAVYDSLYLFGAHVYYDGSSNTTRRGVFMSYI